MECDDPRVAVGPDVLSESAAIAQAETKHKAPDTASSQCGSHRPVRSGAQYRAVADAGRTRAAEGNQLVANFLLLKSDGPISGFAKNGDAIVHRGGAIVEPIQPLSASRSDSRCGAGASHPLRGKLVRSRRFVSKT